MAANTVFRNLRPEIKEDCDKLIKAFVEKESDTFKSFKITWKEIGFDLIYGGRVDDIDYFIDQIFNVVKTYCTPDKQRLERIAGLYLLYGLYYTQPLKVKHPLRVVLREFENLKDIALSNMDLNKEIPYCFYSLVLDDAFFHVLTPLTFDEHFIHTKEQPSSKRISEADKQDELVKSLFNELDFDAASWVSLETHYNKLKSKLNSTPPFSLVTRQFIEHDKFKRDPSENS